MKPDNIQRTGEPFSPQRLIPPGFASKIRQAGGGIEGERRFLTVMLADVSGFTAMAEVMDPEEVANLINDCFKVLIEIVYRYEGTVDKFIGDCVMALWGAPTAMDDDVFRACAAALRASRRMERLKASWAAEGRKQMRVRIGVHCDTVVVGNVGSRARLSYTVMGDGVNVASRIEGLNKQFGTSICISQNVYERVSDRIVARALARVSIKGRKTEIMVYELLGIAGSDDPELAVHRAVA